MRSNPARTIIRKVSSLIFGRTSFQKTFELLYKISLRGMNFGLSDVEESGEMSVLCRIAKKTSLISPAASAVIFDVGANQGQYALAVNKAFGNKAIIYSFEPGKATYSEFKTKTAGLSNVRSYNIGLSSTKGAKSLYYDAEGSGLASIYKRQLDNIDMNKSEDAKFDTLDSFCSENRINRIDLLKMDVEGHELEVLSGSSKMLSEGKIDAIQLEFGGCNIDSRTYFRDFYNLLEKQYHIYRVLQDGVRRIDTYSELQEIFTTVNYFAELKDTKR